MPKYTFEGKKPTQFTYYPKVGADPIFVDLGSPLFYKIFGKNFQYLEGVIADTKVAESFGKEHPFVPAVYKSDFQRVLNLFSTTPLLLYQRAGGGHGIVGEGY